MYQPLKNTFKRQESASEEQNARVTPDKIRETSFLI